NRCHILGVGRDEKLTDERFRKQARAALAQAGTAQKAQRWCDACVDYLGTGAGGAADYERLAARIAEIERRRALRGDRVLYLALPPAAFPGTIEALGKAGLNRSKGWTRLVIEKPFGHDLASAQALNALVHRYFDEAQVYRIDHYLGKEAVQNLLAFRFGNALFESAWNRDHEESVRISVAEALGIEHRAAYYEQTGALRDMVQNHLTQLLSLTAMEVPAAFQADSIRFEKVKVLRSVAPVRVEAVVFGQYAPGKAKRKKLPGYRQEPGVAPRSHTETFVGLRLEIDNWRWQGVPFHLCTGKRLARRATEITINFRRPPVALFRSLDGSATRASTSRSRSRPPRSASRCKRSTCCSAMPRHSARPAREATKPCCWRSCGAIRRCSCTPTRPKRRGACTARCSGSAGRCARIRRAAPDRKVFPERAGRPATGALACAPRSARARSSRRRAHPEGRSFRDPGA